MIKSNITTRYRKLEAEEKPRLIQGDILRLWDVEIWHIKYNFPYIVILSQDCDLDQDYSAFESYQENPTNTEDKILENILICPAFIYADFIRWEHIKKNDVKKTMCLHGWDVKKRITSNNDKRYYCLIQEPDYGLPHLAVDFKFFITINREKLYDLIKSWQTEYVCSLNELFREELAQKFVGYLSRVATPEFPLTE